MDSDNDEDGDKDLPGLIAEEDQNDRDSDTDGDADDDDDGTAADAFDEDSVGNDEVPVPSPGQRILSVRFIRPANNLFPTMTGKSNGNSPDQ